MPWTDGEFQCLKTAEGVLALGRQKGSLPGTDCKFQCLKTAEGVLARDRLQISVSEDRRRGPCPGPTANFTSPRQQKGSLPRFPENAKFGVVAFALATLPWGPGWQLSLAARSNGAFSIGGLALPAMLHILRGAASFLTRQKYN